LNLLRAAYCRQERYFTFIVLLALTTNSGPQFTAEQLSEYDVQILSKRYRMPEPVVRNRQIHVATSEGY
jgi:hypothetical protein